MSNLLQTISISTFSFLFRYKTKSIDGRRLLHTQSTTYFFTSVLMMIPNNKNRMRGKFRNFEECIIKFQIHSFEVVVCHVCTIELLFFILTKNVMYQN